MHRYFRLLCLLIMLLPGLSTLAKPTHRALAAPDDPGIVGGNPVPEPNPYVWQVSLTELIDTADGTIPFHFCGGSIIAERWILTAAHCIGNDFDRETTFVFTGIRLLSERTINNLLTIKRVLVHPGYSSVLTGNDIALLELDDPIPDAERYIVPLMTGARAEGLSAPGTMATVTGWGKTVPGNSVNPPNYLQYAELPILANQRCNEAMAVVKDFIGIEFDILESMICAGSLQTDSTNVCQGDSGGPLVVPDGRGSYQQVGIVSFGHPYCNPVSVAAYTRVASFIDWIQANTGLDFTTPRAPDLVVESINVNSTNNLVIRIRNQGTARVALDQGFWVDLYVAPQKAPTQANDIWNFMGGDGATWGIDGDGLVLLPDQAINLLLDDSFYWPTLSDPPASKWGNFYYWSITADTPFYVQVDSANANTAYGAIMESHELNGGAYNNVFGPLYPADINEVLASTMLDHYVYMPMIADGNGIQSSQQQANQQAVTTTDLSIKLVQHPQLPPRQQSPKEE